MIYTPPVITILNDREFELVQPFIYEWFEPDGKYSFTVPAGFPFDGASVPRICWTLTGILPTGAHMGAAALHDYTYQRRGRLIRDELKRYENGVWLPMSAVWDRKQCDDMFYQVMQDAGATPWKAWAMWKSVRLFGSNAWNS